MFLVLWILRIIRYSYGKNQHRIDRYAVFLWSKVGIETIVQHARNYHSNLFLCIHPHPRPIVEAVATPVLYICGHASLSFTYFLLFAMVVFTMGRK